MNTEIWVSLDGLTYSNFTIYGYEVSNTGKIRSVDRYITTKSGITRLHKGRLRCTKFNNRGYEMITINVCGNEKTCLIHRLVAIAFIPNIDNLPEVNHIDNTKCHNYASNLEWTTSKENHEHAVVNGFRNQYGENGVNSKLTNADVIKIREMYESGKYKRRELAIEFGVSNSSIGRIIRKDSYKNI